MVLGMEHTGARMSRIARGVLHDVPVHSLDEMLAGVEAVTESDVAALAQELYDPAVLSAACVGSDEACFREAARAVSADLAGVES
jgi:hypothetical protein